MYLFLDDVRRFFEAVAQTLRRPPAFPRERPLVAVPVVGTGRGGAAEARGDVLEPLFDVLYEQASALDVDIALVTYEPAMYTAAQSQRKSRAARVASTADSDMWPDLGDRLKREARRLTEHARTGKLVLFLGAGISTAAGLPSWQELLAELAVAAGLDEGELAALKQLHVLDQAHIIKTRFEGRDLGLGEEIKARMDSPCYTLAHALLAGLPVSEAVTTNYDELYERATSGARRPVAVLPYERPGGGQPWLLKLHGSVTRPAEIVLTREDYIRYGDQRAALAGIVQAMLITRHMLFVGFSLADDNFNRIADDVRKVVRAPGAKSNSPSPFGTALLLHEQTLLAQLWRSDLDCVPIAPAEEARTDSQAARLLEIFLDFLASETTENSSHLLDVTFDGTLTDDERELRNWLQVFMGGVTPNMEQAPAWHTIARLLDSLGRHSS